MYDYIRDRAAIFTEDGQVMFLKIRDNAKSMLKTSGAVMAANLLNGVTGDSWTMLACIDRLVELKELVEVTKGGVAAQHRVFVGPWS
jgi:hypothetical protein